MGGWKGSHATRCPWREELSITGASGEKMHTAPPIRKRLPLPLSQREITVVLNFHFPPMHFGSNALPSSPPPSPYETSSPLFVQLAYSSAVACLSWIAVLRYSNKSIFAGEIADSFLLKVNRMDSRLRTGAQVHPQVSKGSARGKGPTSKHLQAFICSLLSCRTW